jgi:hypothetical protein
MERNDLSRALMAFDQNSTLVAMVELIAYSAHSRASGNPESELGVNDFRIRACAGMSGRVLRSDRNVL